MKNSQLSIDQALRKLKGKELSVTELTENCLKIIKKNDHQINAFITVCDDHALTRARSLDRQIQKTKDVGQLFKKHPLLGIPIALKDNFCTKGIKTTAASKVLADYVPAYDATVTSRLLKAGAIIIGKTNLDAWAHGASGENSDFGPTKNPWNLKMVAGGSSSGSAAAVVSGMALAATGSDTGGSIRMPANFCGLVGLKPTFGRVSRYGVIAMASSFDSIGHLTKDALDSAQMLQVMAGNDQNDSTTPSKKVPSYRSFFGQDVRGLKLGIPREFFDQEIDPRVKSVIKKSLSDLEKLGLKLVDLSLPHSVYAVATYYILVPSEVSSNLERFDGIRYGFDRRRFSDEAKRRIMLGTYALSAGYYEAYYEKAMRVRNMIKKDVEKAFEKVDLIFAPVSPTLPFEIGKKVNDPLAMYLMDIYTCLANLAGIPSLAFPTGFAEGLPVGVQLMGPQFEEEKLFQVVGAYQQQTDWHSKRPDL
ncbi:Asp-tRNA(Asn)/Glu-tRNA(Gln) amidotransferase subunit GatA [Patescibacteria group bacterium]